MKSTEKEVEGRRKSICKYSPQTITFSKGKKAREWRWPCEEGGDQWPEMRTDKVKIILGLGGKRRIPLLILSVIGNQNTVLSRAVTRCHLYLKTHCLAIKKMSQLKVKVTSGGREASWETRALVESIDDGGFY